MRYLSIVWMVCLPFLFRSYVAANDGQIEFNRDIRPILSDNCFQCHGPDERARQVGLRLDKSEPAQAALPSGKTAIVPTKVGDSELVRRIMAADPADQMPPADSGKKLTVRQRDLLCRWIEQGAVYQPHWSFVTPKHGVAGSRSVNDLTSNSDAQRRRWKWPLNPIDEFVLDRLEVEGLEPSPTANREQLLRRVTLDLTGVPPTVQELDEFLTDNAPDAYEHLADRLLASPRYGERMTLDWLDAARYADTHGFNNDTTRSMWRWRDWTINAFNSGMPYDQFVTEQLAGDLLPNPTLEQQIATGFNRNHVINSEGGIIPEEYRVEYVADRVHTTATIFMGLSMGCARCHDHKFDPLTQREYYQFFAFFNQLDEKGEAGRVGNAEPAIKAPTPEQSSQQRELTQQLIEIESDLQQRRMRAVSTIGEWEPPWKAARASVSAELVPEFQWSFEETTGNPVRERRDPQRTGKISGMIEWTRGKIGSAIKLDGTSGVDLGDIGSFERTDKFSLGAWINVSNTDATTVFSRRDETTPFRGFDVLLVDGKLTARLVHRWPDEALHVVTKADLTIQEWHHVFVTYDGSSKAEGLKLYVDGQQQEVEIKVNLLTETTITTESFRLGYRTGETDFRGLIDEVRIDNRELTADDVLAVTESDRLDEVLALATDQRSVDQMQSVAKAYLNRFDPEFVNLTTQRSDIEQRRSNLEKTAPSTMVMQEMPQPRQTFLLKRGQYDQPAETVGPDVPASLPAFPSDAPRNRLGLAQWLLSPEHPLTARVAVNRAWSQFFGTGLVETVEDFGSQGLWPSHLELLDWLAVELGGAASEEPKVRNDDPSAAPCSTLRIPRGDVKHLHRLIVTSATYKQSSHVTPELQERDPLNRLLARGSRFRLPAETIRDNALAVAGLLSDHCGGPSVSPYQPAGLWDDVAVGADYAGTVYQQDKGENLYRRSMYTFWKRTCPPPGLNTFDAPEREVCTARRSRTNTPLQALVLMNDPTYLEAARRLAERTMTEGGATPESRIVFAFRISLSRRPSLVESGILLKIYQQRLTRYQHDPSAAKALLTVGESLVNQSLNPEDLAAWTAVMSVILNLDEAITKG